MLMLFFRSWWTAIDFPCSLSTFVKFVQINIQLFIIKMCHIFFRNTFHFLKFACFYGLWNGKVFRVINFQSLTVLAVIGVRASCAAQSSHRDNISFSVCALSCMCAKGKLRLRLHPSHHFMCQRPVIRIIWVVVLSLDVRREWQSCPGANVVQTCTS